MPGNQMATPATFTQREFRDALSSFATGVTIVTTLSPNGEPVGMTASSFNSVSTEPPLILWSVTKSALSAPAFRSTEHFAVHVLATDQTDLANRFAQRGEDKFADTEFDLGEHSVPILLGCAARFDCTTWAIYEGGDHWIIVGKVEAIESDKKEGLVFGGGSYAAAAPLTTLGTRPSKNVSSDGLLDSMLFYHLSRAYHQMGHQFHQAVRESGMTVAEWRVSACLFGNATHAFPELMERTYLDAQSLSDILSVMQEDGFCHISQKGDESYVTGTDKGHDRVKHLFKLAHEQEKNALKNMDGDAADRLKNALQEVVAGSSH